MVSNKFSFYFGLWTTILLLIASGSVHLDNVFPANWIPIVTAWSSFLGAINSAILTALNGYASNTAGPLVSKETIDAAKKAAVVLVAIGVAMLLAAPAMAQTKLAVRAEDRAGPATSDPGGSLGTIKPDDLWGKLQAAKREDLVYAKALADGAGTEGSKLRAACWGAWIALIDMKTGANAKGPDGQALGPMPDPHLFSTFEQMAQVADALQPNAPFMAACAPVAQGLKMRIMDFVGKVVGGGLSLGTLVPGL